MQENLSGKSMRLVRKISHWRYSDFNIGVEGIQPKRECNNDTMEFVLTERLSFSVADLACAHVISCESSGRNHAIFSKLRYGSNVKTTKIAPPT